MAKKKELEAQIDELATLCARLVAHVEVVAVVLRSREAAPADDLDDAIDGIHELDGRLRG